MIQLSYSACTLRHDPHKGTMGESFPHYDLKLWSKKLEPEEVEDFKAQITRDHITHVKMTPWAKNFPLPTFYQQDLEKIPSKKIQPKPLPWKWHGDIKRAMSAVLDAEGKLVCGSLICRQGDIRIIASHQYIVEAANEKYRMACERE